MDKARISIIELVPEYLVIAAQLEAVQNILKVKVYERERFFINPDPLSNDNQIALHSTCPNRINEIMADIRDMYKGWSRIDKTQPMRIIGIHNQDPQSLYIQFSIGDRYFSYKRCSETNRETVYEELFGKKHHCRLRALNSEDGQYLISNLKFNPKARKAISFYPYKKASDQYWLRFPTQPM